MSSNCSPMLVLKIDPLCCIFCCNQGSSQGLELLPLSGFLSGAKYLWSQESEVTPADPVVVAVWGFPAPFYQQVSLHEWSESCGVKGRASEQLLPRSGSMWGGLQMYVFHGNIIKSGPMVCLTNSALPTPRFRTRRIFLYFFRSSFQT